MAKKKNKRISEEEAYQIRAREGIEVFTSDVGKTIEGSENKKQIQSKYFWYGGEQYWMARAVNTNTNETLTYWTTGVKSPQILNFVNKDTGEPIPEGKCRGNINWVGGGGNPAGKPKGAITLRSARDACSNLGVQPAEFLAGVISGNPGVMKKYRVKNHQDITLAQKIKCAETLLNKLQPSLKPADIGTDGEPMVGSSVDSLEQGDGKKFVQVYLPEKGATVEIATSEREANQIRQVGTNQFMKEHAEEVLPYNTGNEEDKKVWED